MNKKKHICSVSIRNISIWLASLCTPIYLTRIRFFIVVVSIWLREKCEKNIKFTAKTHWSDERNSFDASKQSMFVAFILSTARSDWNLDNPLIAILNNNNEKKFLCKITDTVHVSILTCYTTICSRCDDGVPLIWGGENKRKKNKKKQLKL